MQKLDGDIETATLDLTKAYWTDEKVSRLRAFSGSNRNLVAWLRKALKKAELPNDLIMRDDGKRGFGANVMVSVGVSYRGGGALCFAPGGAKVNYASFLEIARGTNVPEH